LFTLLSSKRKSSAFIVDESKSREAGESASEMPFDIREKNDAESGFWTV
jgi:hypothetical protein